MYGGLTSTPLFLHHRYQCVPCSTLSTSASSPQPTHTTPASSPWWPDSSSSASSSCTWKRRRSQTNAERQRGRDKEIIELNMQREELKLNVFIAWIFTQGLGLQSSVLKKQTVSVRLLGYSTNRGLEAKRGDCNEVVGVCFCVFLYSEITQRPVNVLKSVSVCIKLLYIW